MALSLKHISNIALDALLPPLCIACDEPVGKTATLCPDCWKNIGFISAPFCACCGTPFDFAVEEGALCVACLNDPPRYRAARAAMIYDDSCRPLVLGFKHGDQTHKVKALAKWMQRAGSDILADADALAPVPLHRWRLFHRRYNQSALLAHEISNLTRINLLPDALSRTRNTPPQGQLKRKERIENIENAFDVTIDPAPHIEGKNIVLIDDVLTTGATVNECARILLEAGAKHVDVLTLARVRRIV